MSTFSDWIDSLAPGDRVLVRYSSGSWSTRHHVGTVARRTKTLIVLEDGQKFDKIGRKVPRDGSWSCRNIQPFDQILLDAQMVEDRRRQMAVLLNKVKWHELDSTTLEQVIALVMPSKDGKEQGSGHF